VLNGWRGAATELVGARLVLDRYAERPTGPRMAAALERARRKDWMLMAAMAGKASAQDARAIAVGRKLEEKARAGFNPALVERPHRSRQETAQHSLLSRLKARLAA
jgi:hypothetical protein